MQEKKHEVIVNGVPKIENIPKDTIRVFCETVLREVEEYYQSEKSTAVDVPKNKDTDI